MLYLLYSAIAISSSSPSHTISVKGIIFRYRTEHQAVGTCIFTLRCEWLWALEGYLKECSIFKVSK